MKEQLRRGAADTGDWPVTSLSARAPVTLCRRSGPSARWTLSFSVPYLQQLQGGQVGKHPVLDFGEGPVYQAPAKRKATRQAGPPRIPHPAPAPRIPRTHREPRPAGRLRGAPAAPTHSADSRQQLQGGPQRGGLRGSAGRGSSTSTSSSGSSMALAVAVRRADSRSGPAIPAPLPAGRRPLPAASPAPWHQRGAAPGWVPPPASRGAVRGGGGATACRPAAGLASPGGRQSAAVAPAPSSRVRLPQKLRVFLNVLAESLKKRKKKKKRWFGVSRIAKFQDDYLCSGSKIALKIKWYNFSGLVVECCHWDELYSS